MIIHLSELQDGENEFRFEEDPEELHIHTSDLCFKSPIRTQLTVYKLGESCSVSGNTEIHLQLACARCLEPFDLRLATPLSFVLQKGRPDSIEGDEDETLIWVDEESEKLDLGKTPVTDAAMESLGKCTGLKELSLWDVKITDAGLAHLHGLKKLEKLQLNYTKVTDEGVTALQEALPNCKITR